MTSPSLLTISSTSPAITVSSSSGVREPPRKEPRFSEEEEIPSRQLAYASISAAANGGGPSEPSEVISVHSSVISIASSASRSQGTSYYPSVPLPVPSSPLHSVRNDDDDRASRRSAASSRRRQRRLHLLQQLAQLNQEAQTSSSDVDDIQLPMPAFRSGTRGPLTDPEEEVPLLLPTLPVLDTTDDDVGDHNIAPQHQTQLSHLLRLFLQRFL